jgi:preprotein translocase subunit Sec61beta
MKDLFSSKETALFIKGIKEGKVTSSMLHDFSNELFESFKPQQWLKALWEYFPASGVFFISAGIIGSFADTSPIVDYSVYPTLIVGVAFFLSGILQLIRLGKRLM